MIEQKYCVFQAFSAKFPNQRDCASENMQFLEKEKNINTPLRNSLASYFFELYAVRVKSLLVEEATT